MARRRVIDPDFWSDPEIAELPFAGRLLYIGLWNFADDQGVIPYQPRQIRAWVFPYDPKVNVEGLLEKLIELGKLTPYEADGGRYLHIKNFCKHQTIRKPTFKYPPQCSTSASPVQHQCVTSASPVQHQCVTSAAEKKRKEKKGSRKETIHDMGIVTSNDNNNTYGIYNTCAPPPAPIIDTLNSEWGPAWATPSNLERIGRWIKDGATVDQIVHALRETTANGKRSIHYAEAIVRRLREEGVRPGETVAIYDRHGTEVVESWDAETWRKRCGEVTEKGGRWCLKH